jgi:L-cysteine/cystine lyase
VSGKADYIRRELMLPDELVAVNAGSWGPLCRAARKAIREGYEEEAASRGDDPRAMREIGSGLARYSSAISEAKDALARFLNCSPDEVALCDSSTTGMNIFLWGYDFEPGDELVAGSLENPAALVPLRVLERRRGVKVRFADLGNGDVDAVEAIKGAMNPRTRMILISNVDYATGTRVDLEEISSMAHDRGVLVLADGIQAMGTTPVDVKELGADGYAMGRHKFLCGPDGAGALYVNGMVLQEVMTTYAGVFSDSEHGMGEGLRLMDTAQRYEVSTRPIPVIKGGTACLNWFMDEVGLNYVYQRCRSLYRRLWGMIDEIDGVSLLSRRDQSSLMTFAVDGVAPGEVVARLRKSYIFSRNISATNPQGTRLSVGVWNRESDLEEISKAVEEIAEGA